MITAFAPAADLRPPPVPRLSTGRRWPVFIVALLLMNMTIVGITVYFAASDKSAAVEPDYYAKALKFGDVIQQRESNRALGWTASASLCPTKDAKQIDLVLTMTDRGGAPLTDASASVVAFASARAGNRQTLTLRADPRGPGVYSSPIHIDRSGLWCLRLTVRRGQDTFTQQSDLIVPDAAE